MLTVGELFAGIGGFGFAFERAGFKTHWSVEIDPNCQRVLRHHWPDVPVHGDITQVDPAELEPVDVITFGSPCQDLSVAGKRAGLSGERSGLFYEATRIIEAVRPRFAVWENVPGALSSAGGRDFGAVLDALAESGAMDIAWAILDAQWFGVPQRRRRVFVVADFAGERAGEILSVPYGMRGDSPPRREAGESVAATLTSGIGVSSNAPGRRREGDVNLVPEVAGTLGSHRTGGWGNDLDNHGAFVPVISGTSRSGHRGTDDPDRITYIPTHVGAVSSKWAKGSGGPSGDEVQNLVAYGIAMRGRDGGSTPELTREQVSALRASQGGGDKAYVAHTLSSEGADASEDGTGRGTPLVPVPFDTTQITSRQNGNNPKPGDPSHPLASSAHPPAIAGEYAVRRLTPTECLRLQGLPDHWLDLDPPLSDSAKYRMIGNGVALPVVEWVARRIMQGEQESE